MQHHDTADRPGVESGAMCYRVRNWAMHYENHDSRRLKATTPLKWVAVPTQHDGKRFRRIGQHQDGPAIFAAWILILQVAARCPMRGVLVDDYGHPLDADDLADLTGFPATMFAKALVELTAERIGWLEKVSIEDASAQAARNCAQTPEDSAPTLPNPTQPDPTEQNKTQQNPTRGPDGVSVQKGSNGAGIGPEGLGPGVRRTMANIESRCGNGTGQQVAVLQALQSRGVRPEAARNLSMRRDITPELIDEQWADVQ